MIDPDTLPAYNPAEDEPHWDRAAVAAQCREVIRRLAAAQRSVVLAGTGVRLSGSLDLFRRVIARLAIPVATAWAHDLIPSDDPLFCGRQGAIGERAGNFTVQNADAL